MGMGRCGRRRRLWLRGLEGVSRRGTFFLLFYLNWLSCEIKDLLRIGALSLAPLRGTIFAPLRGPDERVRCD